jgi:tRNA threonylcarbamoyladenosine biosynthesis protein TsaE
VSDRVRISLLSHEETFQFGVKLAGSCQPNTVIALSGDLGAGKTTLVQGIALGLGIQEAIQSPTFVYLNVHLSGRLPLYHFDLYRLVGWDAFMQAGFWEYLEAGGITVLEWPERAAGFLPAHTSKIELVRVGTGREVIFDPCSVDKIPV